MEISCAGLTHRTAPIAIRERLAVGRAGLADASRAVRAALGASETVLISTCNRVEVYAAAPSAPTPVAIASALGAARGFGLEGFEDSVEGSTGREAAFHLFLVTAGADSMVLGETEVQSQVKEAYEAACTAGTVGPILHALFQRALSVGKWIRTRTGLGRGSASVGSVAVDLAMRVFETLSDKTALLLGAGQTGSLVLKHLAARGLSNVLVSNRTHERAEALAAAYGGRTVPWDSIPSALPGADVVIACLDAPRYVVLEADARRALQARRMKPVILHDHSNTRANEPGIDADEDAYLYNMDDLQRIAEEANDARAGALEEATRIARRAADRFQADASERRLGAAISALRDRMDRLAAEEIERASARLGTAGPEARQAAEEAVRRSLARIFHEAVEGLKAEARDGRSEDACASLRRFFKLPEVPEGPGEIGAVTSTGAAGEPGAPQSSDPTD